MLDYCVFPEYILDCFNVDTSHIICPTRPPVWSSYKSYIVWCFVASGTTDNYFLYTAFTDGQVSLLITLSSVSRRYIGVTIYIITVGIYALQKELVLCGNKRCSGEIFGDNTKTTRVIPSNACMLKLNINHWQGKVVDNFLEYLHQSRSWESNRTARWIWIRWINLYCSIIHGSGRALWLSVV